MRDNLFPMYFGETGKALERKLTVVNGMATLRKLLSPFMQGVEGADEQVRERLLRSGPSFFPQIDELCRLIQSEF